MQPGASEARHWSSFAQDCWAWAGRPPDRFDIVAYQYSPDELIEIPRLGEAG